MDEEDRAAAVDAGNESLDKVNTALDELVALYKARMVTYSNQNLSALARMVSFTREAIQKEGNITGQSAALAVAIERLADLT